MLNGDAILTANTLVMFHDFLERAARYGADARKRLSQPGTGRLRAAPAHIHRGLPTEH